LFQKVFQLSCIGYGIVEFGGYNHTYIYGYNFFLWGAIIGFIGLMILIPMNEEEPKKEISVLDKEINEMKSKLDELEKEKAKEVPDFSEYNEKMNEQPMVM